MKKLLFCVLAMIAFAGTSFAASDAWGFAPENEVCFLSNDLGVVDINATVIQIDQTWNRENLLQCHNETNIKSINVNGQRPVSITKEESGVSSRSSISCLSCHTIGNPLNVIIDNGSSQKRVTIYPC